jgi:hypothetical protein
MIMFTAHPSGALMVQGEGMGCRWGSEGAIWEGSLCCRACPVAQCECRSAPGVGSGCQGWVRAAYCQAHHRRAHVGHVVGMDWRIFLGRLKHVF